ncbi:MFS transporter [Achromobacter sp. K91]|uniref:MFS transporter n=1 Tax=Achromobacter sp. K91 TaxID=2292262 RepID=UPI000E664F02|nr:MFS transporter [Achromobacter sp. K91]RII99870.1 MFS transporter [Achromobacter sp. K91]
MSATPSAQAAHGQPKPSMRAMAGLLGIFLAAMMAGLNNRVGVLALADLRGALGAGFDGGSWLTTAYSAGELIAMPFAAWFAITLSVRRFELWMLGTCTTLALVLPAVQDLHLLLALRFLQGLASGTTIPLLMMAALKFLPPPIRLYGLALYAMTATFAPNLSIWLAGLWTDALFDWRWVYWQIIPLAVIAAALVGWGLHREPVDAGRFRQANWFGMACGVPAFGLIAVALDQGVRLDWFNSPLVTFALAAGVILLVVYLLTEWYHPMPFIKLQVLGRRNLVLGFTLFVFLLVVLLSGSLLPAGYLAPIQDYRPAQMASIGLIVALPQLVLGFAVALLLYRKWVDARMVFSAGLVLIALACLAGAQLTVTWNREQFVLAQALQAVGQPMAVVSMLFLITSVVQPHEGPYVSGAINTLRALGSVLGAAVVGQLLTVRGRFHAEMLLGQAALVGNYVPDSLEPGQLMRIVSQQSLVLSIADAYRVLGVLALLLIPIVLRLNYIPPPDLRPVSRPSTVPSSIQG